MPYIKSITNFHTPYVYFYQYVDIYFTKLNTCINYSTKLLFDTGQGNSDLINQIQECSHPSRLLSNLTLTNNLYSVVSRLFLSQFYFSDCSFLVSLVALIVLAPCELIHFYLYLLFSSSLIHSHRFNYHLEDINKSQIYDCSLDSSSRLYL